jgi:DNA-binding CsgD family transcriptional regulator
VLSAGAIEMLSTRTRDEFRHALIRFTKGLGFETVSAFAISDGADGVVRQGGVDNTPTGYSRVFADPAYARRDPVMQHCKYQSTPIVWDQSTYVDSGAASKYEIQAAFGLKFGIALAMHLPKGQHFFLGVDRDEPLPSDPDERARLVGAVTLLTLYAQTAAWRTIVPPAAYGGDHKSPTARELEVLRWTLAGKTAWEVGRVLGISERTAAIHANRATHKLGCAGKHQAALKAFRLGMI